MADFVLVSPLLTATGALRSLVDALGEDKAKPVPLKSPEAALTNFRVNSSALSITAAAKLGVGSIFSGAASTSDRGFFFDAMTFTDEYREDALPDKSILATRWGLGIRVLLRVTELSANASLNFGLVGAAVELQQARAQYEILGYGIGADGLVIVLEELDVLGDFRYDTYQKLNGSVVKKLAKYIKDKKATLQPQPVAVALAQPLDNLGTARATYFAMRQLTERRPLADALSRAPVTLDRDTIRETYLQVAKTDDPTQKPSSEAEQVADRWLSM